MRLIDSHKLPTVTPFGIYGFFGEFRFLSNYYPSPLVMPDGIAYPTAEHAYASQKTNDTSTRAAISKLATPSAARQVGQRLTLRQDWVSYRIQAMYDVVHAKFWQNPELAQKLKDTGMLYLEETNNWGDTFWGGYAR